MAHEKRVTRANPSCIIFLIDQSGSMAEPWVSGGKAKCEAVANTINETLTELIMNCSTSGEPRDYFQVAVLGYGARAASQQSWTGLPPKLKDMGYGATFGALIASSTGQPLIPISELATLPIKMEERTRKVRSVRGTEVDELQRLPVFFTPVAEDGTPMYEAFELAHYLCEKWVAEHQNSFPPTIINITDGIWNTISPRPVVEKLQALTTTDGPVLVYNAHISSNPAKPLEYPDDERFSSLAEDKFARELFEMSSTLPKIARDYAKRKKIPVQESSRGYVFNGDAPSLVRLMAIGTESTSSSLS
jgi:hypothetical protein